MKALLKKLLGNAGYEVQRKRSDLYDQEGLRTGQNHQFMKDERFADAYSAAIEATNNEPQRHGPWRVHVALWIASNALRLGGDFVECGVYRGFMSSAIVNYLRWNSVCGVRNFFLFDTFSGFVPNMLAEKEKALERLYGEKYKNPDNYNCVVDSFRNVANVKIVRGVVPDSLRTQDISSVSYLHLDMNCAAPEVAALEYFWPKMTKGAFVLMDDYAFLEHKAEHDAFDEFAKRVNYEVLYLPTGQGLLIK
jgi:hypothetical protein